MWNSDAGIVRYQKWGTSSKRSTRRLVSQQPSPSTYPYTNEFCTNEPENYQERINMLDQQSLYELIKNGVALDLAEAMEISTEARVICSSQQPFTILFANKAWTMVSRIEQHEIIGKSILKAYCSLIDLKGTRDLLLLARTAGFASIDVTSTDAKSNLSENFSISIRPIVEDSFGQPIVSFYLFTVSIIPPNEINFSRDKDHSIFSHSSLTESHQTNERNNPSPSWSTNQQDRMMFDQPYLSHVEGSYLYDYPILTEKRLRLHDQATSHIKPLII